MLTVHFIFTGCDKEEAITSSNLKKDTTSEKFKVIDGVLHIGDSINFSKNTLEIMNMSEPEFREWERSLGFKSLRTWIREANDAMDRTTNMEELAIWKKRYGEILEIGEKEIKPFIEDVYAQCFGNIDGEYYVDKFFIKALPDKILYLKNGNGIEMNKYLSYNKSNPQNGLFINNYIDQKVTRNGCPAYQEIWRKHDDKGVMFRFQMFGTLYPLNPNYSYTYIKIGLYAKKKNWLGKWKDGIADLKVDDMDWQVTDTDGVIHSEMETTKVIYNTDQMEAITHCNDYQLNGDYIRPEFDFKVGLGTSNYLDYDKFAIHCCGVPSSQCPSEPE